MATDDNNSTGNRGNTKGNSSRSGNNNGNGKQNRGFAAMDPDEQRKIASKGGQASHGGGRKSDSSND